MTPGEFRNVSNWLPCIDISHYQGEIDWAKVAQSGIRFAWIKATDGNSGVDPMLKRNYEGAAGSDIPFGLYHFWRPGVEGQADHFLNVTREIPYAYRVALDIETGALTESTQQAALDWLKAMSDPLNVSERPIVYVSPSYADLNLTDPAWTEYPLWVAQYTDNPKPRTSHWPDWMFWQWSARGTVPGIPNPVDLDWFNGTDLASVIGRPAAPPMPTSPSS